MWTIVARLTERELDTLLLALSEAELATAQALRDEDSFMLCYDASNIHPEHVPVVLAEEAVCRHGPELLPASVS